MTIPVTITATLEMHEEPPVLDLAVEARAVQLAEAAPELLEALESIAELRANGPHISAKDGMASALGALAKARVIARAAIAKATGDA